MVSGLWKGPSALTMDFVNVLRRFRLLGFNSIRLPFSMKVSFPAATGNQPRSKQILWHTHATISSADMSTSTFLKSVKLSARAFQCPKHSFTCHCVHRYADISVELCCPILEPCALHYLDTARRKIIVLVSRSKFDRRCFSIQSPPLITHRTARGYPCGTATPHLWTFYKALPGPAYAPDQVPHSTSTDRLLCHPLESGTRSQVY